MCLSWEDFNLIVVAAREKIGRLDEDGAAGSLNIQKLSPVLIELAAAIEVRLANNEDVSVAFYF